MAARNELAKTLKRDGDRAGADRVAALRRPSWTDWALTVVADRDRATVEHFVTVSETAREAQAAAVAGRGGDLRGALRDLREALTDVATRGNKALTEHERKPDLDELTARLGTVAGDAELCRRLAEGTLPLGAEPQRSGDEATGADDTADHATFTSSGRRRRLVDALDTAAAEHHAITERLAMADADVDAARAAADEASAALESAKREHAAARQRLKLALQRRDPLASQAATAVNAVARAQRALDKFDGA